MFHPFSQECLRWSFPLLDSALLGKLVKSGEKICGCDRNDERFLSNTRLSIRFDDNKLMTDGRKTKFIWLDICIYVTVICNLYGQSAYWVIRCELKKLLQFMFTPSFTVGFATLYAYVCLSWSLLLTSRVSIV